MRRVLLVLLVVVLVPVLFVGIVLFSAHRQIRNVDPPLPDIAELLASVETDDGPVRIRYVNTATQPTADGRKMGHVAIVLDWADGRRFVIDQGMEPETALEFGAPMETLLDSGPTETHGSVADQMGKDALAAIRGLAFTHLHHDHTQGIVALCRARGGPLPSFQTPFQFEQRNYTTDMGYVFIQEAQALPGSDGCAKPTLLEPGQQTSIYPIPGFPGLVAVPAAGHTPGSTLFLTRIDDRYWLFSGDITNTRRDLVENLPKAAIYSLLIVPEDTKRTERMRRWLGDLDTRPDLTVIVSHDLSALEETSIPAW